MTSSASASFSRLALVWPRLFFFLLTLSSCPVLFAWKKGIACTARRALSVAGARARGTCSGESASVPRRDEREVDARTTKSFVVVVDARESFDGKKGSLSALLRLHSSSSLFPRKRGKAVPQWHLLLLLMLPPPLPSRWKMSRPALPSSAPSCGQTLIAAAAQTAAASASLLPPMPPRRHPASRRS